MDSLESAFIRFDNTVKKVNIPNTLCGAGSSQLIRAFFAKLAGSINVLSSEEADLPNR